MNRYIRQTQYQKGFSQLILIIIAGAVLVMAGGTLYYKQTAEQNKSVPGTQAVPGTSSVLDGQTNQQAQERDDFGCWPPSCSVIPDAQGKQACIDWKAGKAIQWPPDCNSLPQPTCVKLCGVEKANPRKQQPAQQSQQQPTGAPTSNPDAYKAVAQKIAAHELPPLFTLEFKDGVIKEDEEKFREGVKTMDFFLNKWFSHSITRKTAIRVSATSNESKVIDENGTVVALMGMQEGSELSVIKKYAQFEPFADYRVRYIAHEFVHFYQLGQGCVNVGRTGETFTWFTEGEADWLSFKAQRESGKLKNDMSVEQWAAQGLQQRIQRGISVKTLQEYERAGHFEDMYPYFTLAVEFLMKNRELKTLDNLCANIGKGQPVSTAFQNASGVSLEKFYQDFETYRKTLSSGSYPGQPSQGQTPQGSCSGFDSVPSCSVVGAPGSQDYNYCKQCYPDK